MKLTIATRESPLALWQAQWVKAQLEARYPELTVVLLGMTTQADRLLETPLYKVGGKGLFVKELEEALLDGRADIAVHSMKDVPMMLPPGLIVPVMCEREDPRDAFVSSQFESLMALPQASVVGTSSLRRQSQILSVRPDLTVVPLRGNVNTRLNKLDQGEFAAIILAAAGLKRLDLASRIRQCLPVETVLPAAGQGVLGIECRREDAKTQAMIATLNHAASYDCVVAERALCRTLGGGCHVPIAAYAEMQQENVMLRGLVASEDGKTLLQTRQTAPRQVAEELGRRAADDLLRQGAARILAP